MDLKRAQKAQLPNISLAGFIFKIHYDIAI